jgi:hypothetical protein
VDSSFVTVSTTMQGCPAVTPNGIKDAENELEISVYPDPSNGLFHVNLGQTVPVKLKIFNLMGECVYTQGEVQTSDLQVDLRSQPEGMYFLQLTASQGETNIYNFKYSLVVSR